MLAQDDIQNAFPSACISDVVEVLRRHISDLGTLRLIEAVLRGVDGLRHQIGISQGDPISPVCLNLLLHYVLDQSVHEFSGPANRLWLRYADNLVYLCPSMLSGTEAIRRARQLLAPAGFTLKAEDRPLDLTRTPAELLGFRLRTQEGNLRMGLGTNALNELNQALGDTQGCGSPVQAAKSVIEGWIRWYGPVWEQKDARSVTRSLMGMLTRNGLGPHGMCSTRRGDQVAQDVASQNPLGRHQPVRYSQTSSATQARRSQMGTPRSLGHRRQRSLHAARLAQRVDDCARSRTC